MYGFSVYLILLDTIKHMDSGIIALYVLPGSPKLYNLIFCFMPIFDGIACLEQNSLGIKIKEIAKRPPMKNYA